MTETRARYGASRARRRPGRPRPGSGEAAGFPGCEAVQMSAQQLADFDRHIEYWDEQSGVAWMVRETTVEHERPGFRLAVLVHRIGQARGAPIVSYGTTRLEDHTRPGDHRVMEPDQAVFLDAARAAALRSPVLMEAGDGPDVALEVDHTTDVRRRKLGIYEGWRVPEVWMEVPNESVRRRPGLTIYALDARTGRRAHRRRLGLHQRGGFPRHARQPNGTSLARAPAGTAVAFGQHRCHAMRDCPAPTDRQRPDSLSSSLHWRLYVAH